MRGEGLVMQYVDEDGDAVSMETEEEWEECLRLWRRQQQGEEEEKKKKKSKEGSTPLMTTTNTTTALVLRLNKTTTTTTTTTTTKNCLEQHHCYRRRCVERQRQLPHLHHRHQGSLQGVGHCWKHGLMQKQAVKQVQVQEGEKEEEKMTRMRKVLGMLYEELYGVKRVEEEEEEEENTKMQSPWWFREGKRRKEPLGGKVRGGVKHLLMRKGLQALEAKDRSSACEWMELLTSLEPSCSVGWYNLACARLVGVSELEDGEEAERWKEAALDGLQRAVGAGYRRFQHMKCDEDLAALRGDARFHALLPEGGGFPPHPLPTRFGLTRLQRWQKQQQRKQKQQQQQQQEEQQEQEQGEDEQQCGSPSCSFKVTGVVPGFCCKGCSKGRGRHGPRCRKEESRTSARVEKDKEKEEDQQQHEQDSDEREDSIVVLEKEDAEQQEQEQEQEEDEQQCGSPNCSFKVTGVVPGFCCKGCSKGRGRHGPRCRKEECRTSARVEKDKEKDEEEEEEKDQQQQQQQREEKEKDEGVKEKDVAVVEYAEQMETLKLMGFDSKSVAVLLRLHNGDLNHVLESLLV